MEQPDLSSFSFEDALSAVSEGLDPLEAAERVVDGLTAEEKLWCLDGDAPTWAGVDFLTKDGYHKAPFLAARVDRVGIPGIAFSDGPRGVVVGNATCFPVSMGRGSTWDPDLEERVGDAIGKELRAVGATLYGGVCVNLLRHPAWGRAQETYGEDPHHVGEMAAALTRGIQRHAMACVKHFCCNSMENARFKVDISVDDVALHEVYLPHFKRVVDEGVACVMTAYNSVNGAWCGENETLLEDILRAEWRFDGYVISDWIFGLRNGPKSVRSGLDVEMPYRMIRAGSLSSALGEGEITWDDVDACVARLVSTLLRFHPILSVPAGGREVLGSPEHRRLAREVAARSVVLLRNVDVDGEPVLPISRVSGRSLVVFGRLADQVNLGDGGSSDVWALDCVTVLAGLRSAAPELDITHVSDVQPDDAARVAAVNDVAIVVVGYTYEDEGEFIGEFATDLVSLFPAKDEEDVVERFESEISDLPPTEKPEHIAKRQEVEMFAKGGDRTSLRLREADVALIRAVSASNPRTVVVVQAGSAVLCGEWDQEVPAIVQAWYGGTEAGSGLADVLFGEVNPSARLPFSVPVDEADLPEFDRDADSFVYDRWHGWWNLERLRRKAAYPFGFGLSYTTFSLGDVHVGVSGGEIEVLGRLHNSGRRDGADVVQVYATLPDRDAPRRLIGFVRVEVAASSTREFEIRVPISMLSGRDRAIHGWIPPVGPYLLEVARYSADPASISTEIVV